MPVSQTEHIAGYRHLCAGYGRIDGPTSRLSRECSYRHELDVEKFLSGHSRQRFPVSAAGNAAALSAVRIASSAGALRAAVHRDAYWREVAFGRDWTSNKSILVWLVSVFFRMACRALAFDPR